MYAVSKSCDGSIPIGFQGSAVVRLPPPQPQTQRAPSLRKSIPKVDQLRWLYGSTKDPQTRCAPGYRT
ncbi:hypothetical protein RSAG8_05830, partial [Rhizoctonia solani AG-8 WAC10335]